MNEKPLLIYQVREAISRLELKNNLREQLIAAVEILPENLQQQILLDFLDMVQKRLDIAYSTSTVIAEVTKLLERFSNGQVTGYEIGIVRTICWHIHESNKQDANLLKLLDWIVVYYCEDALIAATYIKADNYYRRWHYHSITIDRIISAFCHLLSDMGARRKTSLPKEVRAVWHKAWDDIQRAEAQWLLNHVLEVVAQYDS